MDVKEFINQDNNVEIHVKSEKMKMPYKVVKTNDGFSHFEVQVEKGSVPKELQTRFTGPYKAVKAIEEYLKNHRGSKTLRTEKYGDDYDKRKAKRED